MSHAARQSSAIANFTYKGWEPETITTPDADAAVVKVTDNRLCAAAVLSMLKDMGAASDAVFLETPSSNPVSLGIGLQVRGLGIHNAVGRYTSTRQLTNTVELSRGNWNPPTCCACGTFP